MSSDDRGAKLGRTDLWFFQRCVSPRLKISKIAEDALFELLHVLDGTTKGLEPEHEGTYNVRTRDMIKPVPEDTGDIFLIRKKEAIERGMSGVRMCGVFGVHVWNCCAAGPGRRSGGKEKFEPVEIS
jgi:hypothetical protein